MCPRDEHEFGREHGIMNQMHNYMLIKRDLFGRKARRNTSSSYFEMITSS